VVYGTNNPLLNTTGGTVDPARSFTIDLTSPVGVNTARFFNTSYGRVWTIHQTGSGATLTNNGISPYTYTGWIADGIRLQIPPNYVGVITLTTLGTFPFTVTVNVTANRPKSSSVKVGETFEASGIEWRVLATRNSNSEALVIAEHALEDRQYHGNTPFPRWSASAIRTYLNGTFLSSLHPAFQSDILLTTGLKTRAGMYVGGSATEETTSDRLFLLNVEEAYYAGTDHAEVISGDPSITTGTATNRTNGNTVIFADAYARKVTHELGLAAACWLRSPDRDTANSALRIQKNSGNLTTGATAGGNVTNLNSLRPAMWLNWP